MLSMHPGVNMHDMITVLVQLEPPWCLPCELADGTLHRGGCARRPRARGGAPLTGGPEHSFFVIKVALSLSLSLFLNPHFLEFKRFFSTHARDLKKGIDQFRCIVFWVETTFILVAKSVNTPKYAPQCRHFGRKTPDNM